MSLSKRTIFLGILSFLLVFSSVGISRLLLRNDLPLADSIVSNLLVILAINFLLFAIKPLPTLHIFSTSGRLKNIALTGMVLILMSVAHNILDILLFQRGIFTADSVDQTAFQVIVASIALYATLVLSVYLFLQLYGLVLTKRKKSTKNFFWSLYIQLLIFLVLSSLTKLNLFATGLREPQNLFESLTFASAVLLIFFMVNNSFRNSWVNYLNKNQKLSTLFIGILITTLVILFEVVSESNLQNYVYQYSNSVGTFFGMAKVFFLIYAIMAIISIVLHLPTAGLFDKKVKRLTSLFEVANAVSATMNFNVLFQLVTDDILEVVEADSSWLIINDYKENSSGLASISRVPDKILGLIKAGRFANLQEWIKENKKPLVLHELIANNNAVTITSDVKQIGGSLVGMPLMNKEGNIKGIIFAWKETEYGFDEEDCRMVVAFASQTMIAIENSTLLEQTLEKERLQQELNVAKEIQLRLLPGEIPKMAKNIEIEAISIPANEVGGDYYDFVEINKANWGIYIGDVSGKSISAALYMAEIKGFIQALAKLYPSPKALLEKVNETLYENIDKKSFISFISSVINTRKKTITMARAGHCPMAYYDPDTEEWQYLVPSGIGLGLDTGTIFNKVLEEKTIKYKPGSVIFLYTDGVTEVFNSAGEEFGEEKLLVLLAKCKEKGVTSYVDEILKEIRAFSDVDISDDLTMIVVKIAGQND